MKLRLSETYSIIQIYFNPQRKDSLSQWVFSLYENVYGRNEIEENVVITTIFNCVTNKSSIEKERKIC